MRLLEKYGSIEEAAAGLRPRYSREAEHYCYLRTLRAEKESERREYILFWTNMHHLYGLMMTSRRSDDSLLLC